MNDYWVSETNVWKIYADTEEEAKEIWQKYCDGVPSSELDMKLKGCLVDADWPDDE